MRKSFNYGRDYIFVDSLKCMFGISSLNMRLIESNKNLEVKDKSINSLVNNWKWVDNTVVYSMMDFFENIGDIGKHKHFLKDVGIFRECLKIRLFDGLFRSSDNILRNILIDKNGRVLSIDENDIYGKRKNIFNKNDWFLKAENIKLTRELSKEIIEGWNLTEKKGWVKGKLEYYRFSVHIKEMGDRFDNYYDIVISEIKN